MIDLPALAGEIISRYPQGRSRSALLPLLHIAQERDGYVSRRGMADVADILGLSEAEVYSVASFYSMFHLEPKGTHVISVCHNIACALAGGERLVEALEEHLGIECGETTTDGRYTLERAECLAACEKAPMLQVDYQTMLGPLTARRAVEIVDRLPGLDVDEIPLAARPTTDAAIRSAVAEGVESDRAGESQGRPGPLVDSIPLSEEERRLLDDSDDDAEGEGH